MEALVDLEPEAYREAQRLAAERGQTIGKVLSDSVLGRSPEHQATHVQRLPQPRTGVTITSENIKAMVAEDEELEITKGDPNHLWHSVPESFEPGYPRVVRGHLGLPEIQLRPLPSEKKDED